MPPLPWKQDVPYTIDVYGDHVEATMDLVAGAFPIIVRHYIYNGSMRNFMNSSFAVGMAQNFANVKTPEAPGAPRCLLFGVIGRSTCRYLEPKRRAIRKRALRLAKDLLNQKRSNVFPRCNTACSWCSRIWCEFYDECWRPNND